LLAAVTDALCSGETADVRTVQGILKLARRHVVRYGDEYAMLSDSYSVASISDFVDEAEQIVDRLFPQLCRG